ncbi:hypothetical protein CYLTODRAFT_454880 [Cylindrobasidium torrendii FP15055 ss-10]|uniref:DUF6534 domain-containing protein n=1 Tax=Cylindrobasidium torrendii FP15055 ss-10 TaxID=1314674 RepID=A0A0D7B9T2_9AGAR|nr:hypothetical protein CYLTODRAFT_454880 [Cylindrobasidium torrendii FP15055 ss-10]
MAPTVLIESTLTPTEHHQAAFLLGPWLIGSFLDVFLQGVLCCQFQHYWDWYQDDKVWLKMSVVGLMLLTTLKTIQCFALIWIQSIEFANDLQGALLLGYNVWWQAYNSLFVSIIGLYVQVYFSYRLLVICKSWYIVGFNAFLFAFGFVSQVMACIYIPTGDIPNTSLWFACHWAGILAGDLMLTLLTIFFLIRSRRNVQSQGVSLITSLVRLTFQSAAPAAVCALFNLVFSQVYTGNDALISVAFNMMLPKLYGISMMWTLNARREIRAVSNGTSRFVGGLGDSSGADLGGTLNSSAGRRSKKVMPQSHELGDFSSHGAIEVSTIQETVKHYDLDDEISSYHLEHKDSDDVVYGDRKVQPLRVRPSQ